MPGLATSHIETYLQDHRAGAEGGSDLARRLAEENVGTPYEDFLVRLAQEIEQDVETLEQIMRRLGVGKPVVKVAGAKLGEKLGRLKLNDELLGYSPLSRLLELEGLRGGVQAKLGLWDALGQAAAFDERIDADEIAGLVQRAERQLEGLREHHLMAARAALAE